MRSWIDCHNHIGRTLNRLPPIGQSTFIDNQRHFDPPGPDGQRQVRQPAREARSLRNWGSFSGASHRPEAGVVMGETGVVSQELPTGPGPAWSWQKPG